MSVVGEKKLKFENCYCKYFDYAHVSYSLQNILKYKFSVFKVSKQAQVDFAINIMAFIESYIIHIDFCYFFKEQLGERETMRKIN